MTIKGRVCKHARNVPLALLEEGSSNRHNSKHPMPYVMGKVVEMDRKHMIVECELKDQEGQDHPTHELCEVVWHDHGCALPYVEMVMKKHPVGSYLSLHLDCSEFYIKGVDENGKDVL